MEPLQFSLNKATVEWLYMGKIRSDGTGQPAVLEVRSSDTDNLLTLDLHSTSPAESWSILHQPC